MSLLWPSLVVLLCAAGVVVLLLAGRSLRSRALRSPKAPCRLVSRVDLSPQHVLYVVETADRRLLLGGAPGGLSLLTELPRPTLGVTPETPPVPSAHEAADAELAA